MIVLALLLGAFTDAIFFCLFFYLLQETGKMEKDIRFAHQRLNRLIEGLEARKLLMRRRDYRPLLRLIASLESPGPI